MFKCLSLAVVLAAGCSFDSSNFADGDGGIASIYDAQAVVDATTVDASGDGALIDAAIPDAAIPDASIDAAPDARICVGDLMGFDLLNMDRCDPSDPITNLVLDKSGNYFLSGDDGTLTDPDGFDIPITIDIIPQVGGAELLVLTFTEVEVSSDARLNLLGARPAVIISTGDITVAGRIQAVRRGGIPGAGANVDVGCLTGAGTDGADQANDNMNTAGSGAGGGGFGTEGAIAPAIVNSDGDDSAGGLAAAVQTLEPLRGGCPGGTGGGGGGGVAGSGGGAIHLAAAGTLTVNGAISTSGTGGLGVSDSFSGGGGGGSGGAVLIQCDTFVLNGIITTNGGAGGEGAVGSTMTDSGDSGSITTNNPANGGSGASSGGNGGDGATINDDAQDGAEGTPFAGFATGSGGGGGGLGIIRIETLN